MKILVAVKRVVDYNVKVHVLADHSGLDIATAKMSMNPFDEIAVEQAVRFKEKGVADEVVAVSIGAAKTVDTLRVALAMGADRAIHVNTDAHARSCRCCSHSGSDLRKRSRYGVAGKAGD